MRWAISRLALLALTVLTLCAQPWTRVVHGVVKDKAGRPLDHAVVQLEDESTLEVRSFITQADGTYHFAGLRRDNYYDLSAVYDGIRSPKRVLSKYNSRNKPQVDLTVRLGK